MPAGIQNLSLETQFAKASLRSLVGRIPQWVKVGIGIGIGIGIETITSKKNPITV